LKGVILMTIKQRVTAGAKWCTKTYGRGWRRKISLSRLNVSSECDCILGQLDGFYSRAVLVRGLVPGDDTFRYGFNVRMLDHGKLTAAWKDEIRRWLKRYPKKRAS